MSITRSYNKHTNKYYAYETTYVWDDDLKKKVQRKRCIGQFDPETDEIIPNGRRGRPRQIIQSLNSNEAPIVMPQDSINEPELLEGVIEKLDSIEKLYHALEREIQSLGNVIADLKSQTMK